MLISEQIFLHISFLRIKMPKGYSGQSENSCLDTNKQSGSFRRTSQCFLVLGPTSDDTETVFEMADGFFHMCEYIDIINMLEIRREAMGMVKGEQAGLAKGEKLGMVQGEQAGLARGEKLGIKKRLGSNITRNSVLHRRGKTVGGSCLWNVL